MPFSTVFQLYCSGQCTYPCLPGVPLTSTPDNILSKPLATFPHNHCRNSEQRYGGYESCGNDDHQSSEKNIGQAGNQNQQPPLLKSAMLRTELWGSANQIQGSGKLKHTLPFTSIEREINLTISE